MSVQRSHLLWKRGVHFVVAAISCHEVRANVFAEVVLYCTQKAQRDEGQVIAWIEPATNPLEARNALSHKKRLLQMHTYRCTSLLRVHIATTGAHRYYRCTLLLRVHIATTGAHRYYGCTLLQVEHYFVKK